MLLNYLNMGPAQVQWFYHDTGGFSIHVTAHVHPKDADIILYQAILQCGFKLVEVDDQLFKDDDPPTISYKLKDERTKTEITIFSCVRHERGLTYKVKEHQLWSEDQFVHGLWKVEPKWKMHVTTEEE